MTSMQLLSKAQLRRQVREQVRRLALPRRYGASLKAQALLAAQSVWRNAGAVLFYAALPDELDLSVLMAQALEAGKTVALPRFVPQTGAYAIFEVKQGALDCAPGKFGIAEPKEGCPTFAPKALDLALVPGIAFDATGHRLGRGAGYYDRLLGQLGGVKCGVAFDEQMVPQVPAEAHDIRVNFVLTPTRWLETAFS
jgi:5-formyltetrahydrofolate cyclo-ligase